MLSGCVALLLLLLLLLLLVGLFELDCFVVKGEKEGSRGGIPKKNAHHNKSKDHFPIT